MSRSLIKVLIISGLFFTACSSSLEKSHLFKDGTHLNIAWMYDNGYVYAKTDIIVRNVVKMKDSATADFDEQSCRDDDSQKYYRHYKYNPTGVYFDMNDVANHLVSENRMFRERIVNSGLLEYPLDMKEGDTLRSGQVSVILNDVMGEYECFGQISNRKVEGIETVKTLGGSWKCYRISSEEKCFVLKNGIMQVTKQWKIIEWFNFDVGFVKQQLFEPDGTLNTSKELVKVN